MFNLFKDFSSREIQRDTALRKRTNWKFELLEEKEFSLTIQCLFLDGIEFSIPAFRLDVWGDDSTAAEVNRQVLESQEKT